MKSATGIGHGRVNLIGEHTDYNLGLALPMTLPLAVTVQASLRGDFRIAARSGAYPDDGQVIVEAGAWEPSGTWVDFVTGASVLLAREGIYEHGATITIASDIPPGAGLASSAALSVALVQALSRLGGVTLDDVRIAELARAIETDFVGAPVGMMDQIAAAGEPGRAQLIDFHALEITPVAVPAAIHIEIVDSGIAHANRSGRYRERREECARACARLGVASLREVDDDVAAAARLPAPLSKRVRHVQSENRRVREAVRALEQGDAVRFGALLTESHASLRDDFEASLPAIDALVERAISEPGVYGARLTGGGFGGSVVLARATPPPA
ncbi:MAG TPA: galactokinase family protein [Vicinamibacterales bacterium]